MGFPPRFLDELRERISISELVGRRVRLQRKGREHLGLCPFHNEKTPSFTVSDEKGFYHCFGCGAHGDVISFVTETESLSFPEAVEHLAAVAGIDVPRVSATEREQEKRTAGVHATLEAACAFFEKQLRLPEGKAGLDYLHHRGLDDDVIRRFRLGFAPERRGTLAAALGREGFEADTLVEAGLLKQSEQGPSQYEYFRGRVIFPITDRRRRVVAFGGRALGDQQPKYLNSPESPVFHKGRMLYGLAQARERVRDTGELVVVEGYMDVIALDRPGLPAAVAPLGTAITEEQIRELWRLAPEPVLCLDGDEAGRRAAARAAERALPLLQPGHSLRFALLPPGEDPDSLVRKDGDAALQAIVASSLPLAEVVWRIEVSRIRPDTPERRADLRRRLEKQAGSIRESVVRENYLALYAERLADTFGHARPRETRRDFVAGAPPIHRRPRQTWRGGARRLSRGDAVRAMEQRGCREVVANLVAHPDLIGEFSEFLAGLELPENLDSLRHELLKVAGSARMLDAIELQTHLGQIGYEVALQSLRSSSVHVQTGRTDTEGEEGRVRLRLRHIAERIQRRQIEDETKADLEVFGESEPDRFMRLSDSEQRRRAVEDDSLF